MAIDSINPFLRTGTTGTTVGPQGGQNNSGIRDDWDSVYDQLEGQDGSSTGNVQQDEGVNWGTTEFVNPNENDVSVDDFLALMVAQLKNQDFMNPVDDTQYVTQLAQFATMQQMQELAANAKLNYVSSLVGKEATVAKMSITGDLNQDKGVIEKISLVNGEYKVYVNGKAYTLEQVMIIHQPGETNPGGDSGAGGDGTVEGDPNIQGDTGTDNNTDTNNNTDTDTDTDTDNNTGTDNNTDTDNNTGTDNNTDTDNNTGTDPDPDPAPDNGDGSGDPPPETQAMWRG